jgi:hypothetical protein
MATLFNIDQEDIENDVIFLQLMNIAQTEPEKIVNTALNPLKQMIVDIKQADRLQAIMFDNERVYFPGEHIGVIMTFKVKTTKEVMIKKLAEFLTQPANLQLLNQFRVALHAAEEKQLSAVS